MRVRRGALGSMELGGGTKELTRQSGPSSSHAAQLTKR